MFPAASGSLSSVTAPETAWRPSGLSGPHPPEISNTQRHAKPAYQNPGLGDKRFVAISYPCGWSHSVFLSGINVRRQGVEPSLATRQELDRLLQRDGLHIVGKASYLFDPRCLSSHQLGNVKRNSVLAEYCSPVGILEAHGENRLRAIFRPVVLLRGGPGRLQESVKNWRPAQKRGQRGIPVVEVWNHLCEEFEMPNRARVRQI